MKAKYARKIRLGIFYGRLANNEYQTVRHVAFLRSRFEDALILKAFDRTFNKKVNRGA